MVYFPGIQDLITMWHSLTMGMKEPRITIFTPEIKACIKYAKIIVMSFLILSINYYAQKRTHMLVLHPYISSIFSFFSPISNIFFGVLSFILDNLLALLLGCVQAFLLICI